MKQELKAIFTVERACRVTRLHIEGRHTLKSVARTEKISYRHAARLLSVGKRILMSYF